VTTKTATASPVAQGREHFLADRYSEAITAFEAALADSTGDLAVHRQLGRAHLALGRYDTAQSYIEKALAAEDQNAELYDILGAIHMGRAFSQAHYRDTDDALVAFQQALTIDPERGHTLYNMGLVYAYRDSAALAEQYYQRALAADSTLAPAY
jgi:tetratricopeptide (TPR) repeat protein